MLKDIRLPSDLSYASDAENKPLSFYLQCLKKSKRFDLRLGYFSSNAIRVLSLGFAQFIFNGGVVRIITNHFLSEKDKYLLENSVKSEGEEYSFINSIVNNDVEKLEQVLARGEQHFFDCLRFLMKENRLLLKPVKVKPGRTSHYKEGIFSDGENQIYFNGSCNFTYNGLVENGESLDVKRSWGSEEEQLRIKNEIEKLDSIFFEQDDSHEYLSLDEIEGVIRRKGLDKDLEELVRDEEEIFKALDELDDSLGEVFDKEKQDFKKWIRDEIKLPSFPFDEPFKYQIKAYDKWKQNDYKGLFAMATGTGKTITALNCILEEYRKNGFYRFMVVVPTNPLAHQWQEEVSDKFNYKNVVNSCIDRDWDKQLKRLLSSIKVGNNTNFAFITTYAQLQRSKLKNLFHQFKKEFKEVTFIADEAHTLGSPGGLKNLPTHFEKRIGLSATPERKYDEFGSKKLEEFFEAYPPGYTFYYSMKEAIEKESLSEFEYHPIFVNLEHDEIVQYNEFTNRLKRYIDTKNGGYKDTKEAKQLLIQRKHVIHKAQNKLSAITDIIEQVGQDNFKYAFVYVPEGYEPNYWKEEESRIDIEDTHIINHYSRLLDSKGLIVHNFLGGTKDRTRILQNFEDGKYDALLAMKCLDEGVDVPRTEYAIFCASTGNPRQFIQRRGRVLRTHDDKKFAKIYDLIVSPALDELEIVDDAQVNIEKKIFQNELRRVINFLALATNRYELVEGEFGKKCEEFGIDNLKELIVEELKTYETIDAYEDTE
ncbi:MAG: DEAD/DEAH box helicase family protein [Gracilimonas sp.]